MEILKKIMITYGKKSKKTCYLDDKNRRIGVIIEEVQNTNMRGKP